jgi:hypothetical protein
MKLAQGRHDQPAWWFGGRQQSPRKKFLSRMTKQRKQSIFLIKGLAHRDMM